MTISYTNGCEPRRRKHQKHPARVVRSCPHRGVCSPSCASHRPAPRALCHSRAFLGRFTTELCTPYPTPCRHSRGTPVRAVRNVPSSVTGSQAPVAGSVLDGPGHTPGRAHTWTHSSQTIAPHGPLVGCVRLSVSPKLTSRSLCKAFLTSAACVRAVASSPQS